MRIRFTPLLQDEEGFVIWDLGPSAVRRATAFDNLVEAGEKVLKDIVDKRLYLTFGSGIIHGAVL